MLEEASVSDIDQTDAIPTLMIQDARRYGKPLPQLESYVGKRDVWLVQTSHDGWTRAAWPLMVRTPRGSRGQPPGTRGDDDLERVRARFRELVPHDGLQRSITPTLAHDPLTVGNPHESICFYKSICCFMIDIGDSDDGKTTLVKAISQEHELPMGSQAERARCAARSRVCMCVDASRP